MLFKMVIWKMIAMTPNTIRIKNYKKWIKKNNSKLIGMKMRTKHLSSNHFKMMNKVKKNKKILRTSQTTQLSILTLCQILRHQMPLILLIKNSKLRFALLSDKKKSKSLKLNRSLLNSQILRLTLVPITRRMMMFVKKSTVIRLMKTMILLAQMKTLKVSLFMPLIIKRLMLLMIKKCKSLLITSVKKMIEL